MTEILFDKIGVARKGESKGWNVVIKKEHDEYGDGYYVYLQNPKTNEQFDDYYDNFELLKEAVEEMDVEWTTEKVKNKERKDTKIEFDCPGIIHGGKYDGWTITIEKALDDPSFMCAFLKAPNSTEKYDHFLEDGIDVILEDFVADCDIEWQLDKKLQISEERQKENKVIGWWVKNLPQSQKVFSMMTEGHDATESVGIYVLIGSLVLEFYDKPLKTRNGKELKKFLELYNQFIQEFKGEFLENNGKKTDKNPKAQDSIIAMVSTEMAEGTDPKDYDYVLNLMQDGIMKEEFKGFVNWAKNN